MRFIWRVSAWHISGKYLYPFPPIRRLILDKEDSIDERKTEIRPSYKNKNRRAHTIFICTFFFHSHPNRHFNNPAFFEYSRWQTLWSQTKEQRNGMVKRHSIDAREIEAFGIWRKSERLQPRSWNQTDECKDWTWRESATRQIREEGLKLGCCIWVLMSQASNIYLIPCERCGDQKEKLCFERVYLLEHLWISDNLDVFYSFYSIPSIFLM